MRMKEFRKKVIEILEQQPGIGSTEGDQIRWKTHEIMKLAGTRIDLTEP